MIPEVLELRVGEEGAVAALTSETGTVLVRIRKNDQLLRMRNGERAQQDRVEDTENGGIGTDPQSKSEDGDQGETCVFCEHARGEANVLPDGLESGESPQLAASLSGEHGVAELAARGVPRFFRVDAFGAILFFPLGEMKGQLVFDVAVELAAMEERFEAEAKSVNPFCKHGG